MNKQEYEQTKEIINNSPDGATHVSKNGVYYDISKNQNLGCLVWWCRGEEWIETSIDHLTRSLSDIKTMVTQYETIEKLKRDELEIDLRVMINARKLIKAHKRTSNGRLCSELWGLGSGSGREYCRKLNLDPGSNETPYHTELKELTE